MDLYKRSGNSAAAERDGGINTVIRAEISPERSTNGLYRWYVISIDDVLLINHDSAPAIVWSKMN